MPPDVFLMLSASGISLIAALLFFVSDEAPPKEPLEDPSRWVAFSLPPLRPPPLPTARRAPADAHAFAFELPLGASRSRLLLRQAGDAWVMAIDSTPLADSPALQVWQSAEGGPLHGSGAVHDLRWHGRAGMPKPSRTEWRRPPAKA